MLTRAITVIVLRVLGKASEVVDLDHVSRSQNPSLTRLVSEQSARAKAEQFFAHGIDRLTYVNSCRYWITEPVLRTIDASFGISLRSSMFELSAFKRLEEVPIQLRNIITSFCVHVLGKTLCNILLHNDRTQRRPAQALTLHRYRLDC